MPTNHPTSRPEWQLVLMPRRNRSRQREVRSWRRIAYRTLTITLLVIDRLDKLDVVLHLLGHCNDILHSGWTF